MRFKILLPFLMLPLLVYGIDPTKMSIEEKVGQMLMVWFRGNEINEEAQRLIQQAHVGSFIYYQWANGLESPSQVQKLSNDLQSLARKEPRGIPLFIAIDQEGGGIIRLTTGFTVFPGNGALGKTGQPSLAAASAKAMGEELTAVGINMNLCPVVDVNSNPSQPVIRIRTFSSQPDEVTQMGFHALQGYRQANVIAVLKHFPGYGEAAADPHLDLPVVNKSRESLEKVELAPFRKLVPFSEAVMTAHIVMPALDAQHCATLSPAIIEEMLRKEFGFPGVIISDSLVMQGILNACNNIDEAAIRTILSGHDILIFGGKLLNQKDNAEITVDDILRIHNSIVEAVKSGRIPITRLNASVQRILDLKQRYQLFDKAAPGVQDIAKYVNTPEHQHIAQEIAEKSVTLVRKQASLPLHLADKKIAVIAPTILKSALQQTTLFQQPSTQSLFYSELNPSNTDQQKAEQLINSSDVILVCTYNAWKNTEQAKMIEKLRVFGKPIVAIVTRDPNDTNILPSNISIAMTYSPALTSLQAAINLFIQ